MVNGQCQTIGGQFFSHKSKVEGQWSMVNGQCQTIGGQLSRIYKNRPSDLRPKT